MRYLYILLALAAPAFASVDAWGPVPGDTNNIPCHFQAATNATPIHVTVVSDICGLANNAKIWVYGAINTGSTSNRSSANIHMANSSDANGLCRTVKNLSGTQFDLYDCAGTTAVAGNGTWSNGGLIARVQSYTTKGHPNGYFDGPSGTLTSLLGVATSGGYCDTSRIYMQALDIDAAAATGDTVVGTDDYGGLGARQALKYWCDKVTNTANKTKAINYLMNSLPLYTAACDTAQVDCKPYASSDQMDYKWETQAHNPLITYTLMRADLSAGQKATFVANIIDDQDWTKGGYNYTGTTRTTPAFRTQTGCTVSYGTGSTAVTGSGCSWLTSATVGDRFFVTHSFAQSGFWYQIASITNDNLLNLNRLPYTAVSGTANFLIGPTWVEGTHIGFIPYGYHNHYNMLCGQDFTQSSHSCPDYYGQSDGPFDVNNHTRGRLVRAMHAAITIMEDDPRGGWLFTNASMLYFHLIRPVDNAYGGVTETGPGYSAARIWRDIIEYYGLIKFSFTGDPDLTNGNDNVFKSAGNMALAYLSPESFGGDYNKTIPFTGMVGFSRETGELWWPGLSVMHFRPDLTVAKNVAYIFHSVWPGFTLANVTHGGSPGVMPYYLNDRPDIVPAAPTSTVLDMTGIRPSVGCTLPGGSCVYEPKIAMASRSSYVFGGSAGSELWIDFSSNVPRDHGGNDYGWPHFDIHFVNPLMTGDDISGFPPNTPYLKPQASTMLVGGESNLATGVTALNRKHSSATVAMISASMRGIYTTKPTTANWTMTHAKVGTHGFALARYEMTNGSSVQMGYRRHYFITGSGTPASNTGITVTSGTPSTVALAMASSGPKINESVWGCTPTTENGPLANGSYTGQSGERARYDFLATSGTSATCYDFIQFGPSTITKPTIVKGTSGSHETFEIQDASDPAVILSASALVSNLTSASVATTHSGNALLIVEGLAAGTYAVARNGTGVGGCGSITVLAGEHLLSCASVASGTITVAVAGSGPTITTSSPLTGGTVGVSYSNTLAATGGSTPYTWSCSGCTLPPGLSLSSAGAITGTPTTAGVYTFTPTVTDNASAVDNDNLFSLTIAAAPTGTGTRVNGAVRVNGGVRIR